MMKKFLETDGDKLRMLADLFDKQDAKAGIFNQTEVQDDLRRMARRLDLLDSWQARGKV